MPERRARRRAIGLTLAPGAALLALAAIGVYAAESGPTPRMRARATARVEPSGPGIHIAGSGACLPLIRDLVDRFRASRPALRITVHESIGSTGGVRAVRDGAVHLGLVSRPLHDRERALGLELVVFARVPVTLIAHRDVGDRSIASADLPAIFGLEPGLWSDGTPRTVLLRERGDSAQGALARASPGLEDAIARSLESGHVRVLYHDDDLVRAVSRTPGAIGVSDLVQGRRAAVRVLAVDGVDPDPAAVARGAYPFYRDLGLLLAPGAPVDARAIAEFVRSEEARTVIAAAGALPWGAGS